MRTRVEPIWVNQIALKALEYLLDAEQQMEARTVYQFLATQSNGSTATMTTAGVGGCGNGGALQHLLPGDADFRTGLDTDLHVRQGADVRAMLEAGKKVDLAALPLADVSLEKAVDQVMGHVTEAALNMLPGHVRAAYPVVTSQWLPSYYSDIDVRSILRLARFVRGGKDLLATDAEEYSVRAANWLELLSQANAKNGKPLPYFFKTKSSSVNPNVRIIGPPNWEEATKIGMPPMNHVGNRSSAGFLSPSEGGFTFNYQKGMRTVVETLSQQGARQGRLQPRQIIQNEVDCSTRFDYPDQADGTDISEDKAALESEQSGGGLAGPSGGTGFLAGVLATNKGVFHASILQGQDEQQPPTMQASSSDEENAAVPKSGGTDVSGVSNAAVGHIDSSKF